MKKALVDIRLCSRSRAAPAVWKSLPKTVVKNSDSLTVFKSRLKTSSSPGLSLFPFLGSTLPGLSASEVTSLWRYTNPFIIIIIGGGGERGIADSASRRRRSPGLAKSSDIGHRSGILYRVDQFLRVDNFITVSDKKVCRMSKVSKFCLEKSPEVRCH